ncbi:MAG: trehalose-phosphatase, partial [Chloroflexota bacterium]|nr:trehalose-phosphatase [Chloroflexota bacterium]
VALVAVISGRAAGDARRMLGSAGALVVGNHGAEWLEPGAVDTEVEPRLAGVPAALETLLGRLRQELRRHDGLSFDAKGLSATLHYRNVADPDRARADLLAAVARLGVPPELEVREGRRSVELRPLGVNKGGALRRIVERHALRGVLLFGDDRTDIDAFRAARELRHDGVIEALIAAVGGGPEVVPEVQRAADVVLDSPAELVELLRALAP